MQSALGRSGGDVLGDLGIFRAVSRDHQHDAIYRNGPERLPFQQFIKNGFRLTLGNSHPISQGLEHALRLSVMRLVVTGNVVRSERFDPGDADRFSRAIPIFRTMVGMQTVRCGNREFAVRIVAFAIARGRYEHAHHVIDVVIIEAHVTRHGVGSAVDKIFREPAVIDIDRCDIVELLGMVMDRFPRGLAEAGNWHGQVSLRFAIIEISVQAFEDRPMIGRERQRFQYP